MRGDSWFSRFGQSRADGPGNGGPDYGSGPGYGDGGGPGYGGGPGHPHGGYRPRRRRSGVFSHLGVAVLAAALTAGVTLGAYHPGPGGTAPGGGGGSGAGIGTAPGGTAAGPAAPAAGGAVGSGTITRVVNRVRPGVVIISTTLQYSSERAAGTGMVIKPDGLVLTNNHVIAGATRITATVLGTGRSYPARVVGYDKSADVALIRLQHASGLHTVPLGNSSTVRAGTPVVAMGNAEGQGTIIPAAGTVTATGVTITARDQGSSIGSETLHGMIATTADVVAGDSGGPLASTGGQVIGMDTAGNQVTYQQTQHAGFAIPVHTALSVERQIAAGHRSRSITIGYPPFLGIFLGSGSSSSPQAQAGQLGGAGGSGGSGNPGPAARCVTSNATLTAPAKIAPAASGTLVAGVICGGPAAAAGLTAGSVITAVNGQPAGAPSHVTGLIARFRPGDTISVSWVSPSGVRRTSRLRLQPGPPQ